MGRVSKKQDKNVYQLRREELGLSREKASEIIGDVTAERIWKIENDKVVAHPDEIFSMAVGYKMPALCNYYCANECKIGVQYVPEIKMKDLTQIILEMLASLNSINSKRERLIEITADGKIVGDEIRDFVYIQDELEKISITVETLQLWAEKMIANKEIDIDEYNRYKKMHSNK